VRNLLIAMVVLYVVEMILANFVPGGGVIYAILPWSPGFDLSLVWQPVTQYLVQGPQVLGLLMDLLMVYFFAPWLIDRFTPREMAYVGLSIVLGGLGAGVLWSGLVDFLTNVGMSPNPTWALVPAMGWGPVILGVVALFGLSQPDSTINLMFVFPMKASAIVWLTLAFVGVFFLVQPNMNSFMPFGAIGGVAIYWFYFGGGARRRKLRSKGRKIEKELRFKVYDGGRQGDQDEWIN